MLRPGGQLLFIEHVRAAGGLDAWLQDHLARPWGAFAGGCRCSRSTAGMIGHHFPRTAVATDTWSGMPAIVRPLAVGSATA